MREGRPTCSVKTTPVLGCYEPQYASTGGFRFRQEAAAGGKEDVDVLRNTRVRCPGSRAEQGPRQGR